MRAYGTCSSLVDANQNDMDKSSAGELPLLRSLETTAGHDVLLFLRLVGNPVRIDPYANPADAQFDRAGAASRP